MTCACLPQSIPAFSHWPFRSFFLYAVRVPSWFNSVCVCVWSTRPNDTVTKLNQYLGELASKTMPRRHFPEAPFLCRDLPDSTRFQDGFKTLNNCSGGPCSLAQFSTIVFLPWFSSTTEAITETMNMGRETEWSDLNESWVAETYLARNTQKGVQAFWDRCLPAFSATLVRRRLTFEIQHGGIIQTLQTNIRRGSRSSGTYRDQDALDPPHQISVFIPKNAQRKGLLP